MNFNSKYERKAYGYDFLECNPENDKNYIEYMHEGALPISCLPTIYFNNLQEKSRGVFVEQCLLSTKDARDLYSKFIYKCRDCFRIGGVLEFNGEIGYNLCYDYEDAKKILLKLKEIISRRYGLDKEHLFVCGALHQNTIDRHIHFLFSSNKDKSQDLTSNNENYTSDRNKIIDEIVEFLNDSEYQDYLKKKYNTKNLPKEDLNKLSLNRDLFQFEIGCLSVAKKLIDLEDGEIDNYEDIDVVIRSEIENVAVNLINISQDKKLKDLKFVPDAERILFQIFDSNNETNKKLSDYYFDEYLEGCIEPTFTLIKEGMNHLKGIKFSRTSLSSKRKMNKEYLKTFCDKCKKVANEFSKDYEYKNEMLIHLYEKAVEESRNKEMTKLPFQLQ